MAWRIEEHLIRGEIDNRIRGRVTGRLWFEGRPEPVTLELAGNAWRDLAGRVLRFANPTPKTAGPGALAGLAAVQRGVTGDITASRKVKVPDCTMDELRALLREKKDFPWHWGNSLHLEWHGEENGRVVIEAAHYEVALDAAAAWTMSESEEAAQREANGRALLDFMERLGRAGERRIAEETALGGAGDDDAPQSEAEAAADAEQARLDLLLDRVQARLERAGEAGETPDFERVMEQERERLRRERGEPAPEPLTPEEEAARAAWLAEANAAAEDALAAAQRWADDGDCPDDNPPHPLVERCAALGVRLDKESEERGWLAETDPREHPLHELVGGVLMAGAKLAGALGTVLDAEEWPPGVLFAGAVLVRLKKSRDHLRDALAGLAAADEQRLAEAGWRAEVRAETTEILTEVQLLIDEVRGVLRDAGRDDAGPY